LDGDLGSNGSSPPSSLTTEGNGHSH